MSQADDEVVRVYEELFRGLTHLGPGSRETVLEVLELVGARLPAAPMVADMGCGAGASALVLAEVLPAARIIAVDLHETFLAALREHARRRGVSDRIETRAGDMTAPATIGIAARSLDLIWSEGAAYSVGVETALRAWAPLLLPGGIVALSELVWVVPEAERSAAALALWGREYPAMRASDDVEQTVIAAGLESLGRVRLSRGAWENYYGRLRERVAAQRVGAAAGSVAAEILAGMQEEIDVFDAADPSYGYEFFVAGIGSNVATD